jgi:hypothetical protein
VGYRKQFGDYVFLIEKIGGTNVDAPAVAVGLVTPTNTGDREPTQDPMTGFRCAGTPLGRGHIIALFLGGPDVPENYAPQYEQWQQGGPWKNMELGIGRDAQSMPMGVYLFMVVKLTYGNSSNNYGAAKGAFNSGDLLASWTEFQIPSRFEVWTFRSDAAGAAAVVADLFGADDQKSITALSTLPSRAFLTLQKDFDHSVMPDLDYAFWARNLIRKWASEAADKAKNDYLIYVAAHSATAMKKSTTGRLSRHEQSAIEDKGRRQYGFVDNLVQSEPRWKLANLDKIVTYVRDKLDSRVDHYRFKLADYTALKGTGADVLVDSMLT